mgnify:CR=1 FL=1
MALSAHARLAVVVEVPTRHPMSAWNDAWRHFWGIERPSEPTVDDLIAVLASLELEPEHTIGRRSPVSRFGADAANLVPTARRQLCLPASRDDEIAAKIAGIPKPRGCI